MKNNIERSVFDTTELSLYHLASQDCDVWMTKSKSRFGYTLQIESEEGKTYLETELHPSAAESLADFCKRYLRQYERMTKENEIVEEEQ